MYISLPKLKYQKNKEAIKSLKELKETFKSLKSHSSLVSLLSKNYYALNDVKALLLRLNEIKAPIQIMPFNDHLEREGQRQKVLFNAKRNLHELEEAIKDFALKAVISEYSTDKHESYALRYAQAGGSILYDYINETCRKEYEFLEQMNEIAED